MTSAVPVRNLKPWAQENTAWRAIKELQDSGQVFFLVRCVHVWLHRLVGVL